MKYFYILLFALPMACHCQEIPDLIITNGRIVDGTGNSWFHADIALKNDKIIKVGKGLIIQYPQAKMLDAKNMVVSPGFIDVHAHIEDNIFENPLANNYVFDGVTTVVTGNCGIGIDDIADFFRKIDSIGTSINIATLAGHNTIRKNGMGLENRKATESEMIKMEELTLKAMNDGAVGLSTGLVYLPGMYAPTEEIVALAKIAASKGGVYATHMRNEGLNVVKAIDEALTIGREANIPVQISHFKLSGNSNWGRSNETLDMIIQARKQGYDVTIDQYPYTASSTDLAVRLPDWSLEGGLDSLRTKMKDPILRKKILNEMKQSQQMNKRKNYSFAVVAFFEPDTTLNGKSITQINLEKGRKGNFNNEANTILDMLAISNAQMVYHTMSEQDLVYFMRYPFNMPAADAGVSNGKGMPHPRGYGTNARVLSKYVREEKVIGLEEAIRRMTSLPARKFSINNRGLLLEGNQADILIFDDNTIQDLSVYEAPHQYTKGIEYVLVNGEFVIENGKHTGVKSGSSLKNNK